MSATTFRAWISGCELATGKFIVISNLWGLMTVLDGLELPIMLIDDGQDEYKIESRVPDWKQYNSVVQAIRDCVTVENLVENVRLEGITS